MAQTSSAAREPSMEEILASIRRIIEDSDVSRPAADFPTRGAVAEFRRPPSAPAQPAEREVAAESVATRDILNEEPVLRRPIEDMGTSVGKAAAQTEKDDDEIVLDPQNDDRRPAEISRPEVPVTVSEAVSPSQDKSATDDVAPEINSVKAEAASDGAHILSDNVERQVAQAFGDLNHAVHAAPRRSFDDIATELLQPMLRDWLDSNLPPLVERLVREEIERVVRGNR